ncbi:hypothetical protein JOM56_006208 [Amanita muscaria]|uniref:Complex 1 LYR protein domain-containing protein n=1 Tax=Amanita muscaria (strain Koide BX008) TaxID=946122 RepID=A0A0C2X8H7_AMAMK|nr:hypothetical protein M378DRAFT_65994 [Amanita muscaria Koide BX008]
MHLSLKYFILKQQTIDLYRQIIRASRAIPDPAARSETIAFFRADFNRNKYLSDLDAIENRIKAARREAKLILPIEK